MSRLNQITQIDYGTILWFGKHKNKKISKWFAEDEAYYLYWLHDNAIVKLSDDLYKDVVKNYLYSSRSYKYTALTDFEYEMAFKDAYNL